MTESQNSDLHLASCLACKPRELPAAAAPPIGGLQLLHLCRHCHKWTLWRLEPTWRRARAWRLSPNMSEYYRRSRARTRRAWGRRYGERWASSALIYRSDSDVMFLLSDGWKAGLCLLKMQLSWTLCHCWWIYQIKCWSSRCEFVFFQMNSLTVVCMLSWHCNVTVISNTVNDTDRCFPVIHRVRLGDVMCELGYLLEFAKHLSVCLS